MLASPDKGSPTPTSLTQSAPHSTLGKLRGRAFLGRLTSNLSTMNFRAYYDRSQSDINKMKEFLTGKFMND